jgi:hypothetical protein
MAFVVDADGDRVSRDLAWANRYLANPPLKFD